MLEVTRNDYPALIQSLNAGKETTWSTSLLDSQKVQGSFENFLKESEKTCPYSHLAKDGVIEYNGVIFECDYENNRLTLGDCSDSSKCIFVALENGGTLAVNRDSIGSLTDAITMFSPADIARILKAIEADNMAQQKKMELEEDAAGIGESAEHTILNEDMREQEMLMWSCA